jgi:hyperosmotically inducible protein
MVRRPKSSRAATLVCAFALSGALACVSSNVSAAVQDPQRPDSYDSASGVPAEKPAKTAPTAADQAMTQKIRKAIAADKSLSADGRRVKVTAQGGKVTLDGKAQSEAERTSIFTKAADVAGGTSVVNNISVSAPH